MSYDAVRLVAPLVAACGLALAPWPLLAQVPAGPGDWPQWRGPNRDDVSTERGLAHEWPADGPPVVWQVESVGIGYSAPAIKDGRIILQGDLDGVEHVIALDVRDGSLLWAVQPEPVAEELRQRVAREIERLDRDRDGVVDETEALAGLGTRFGTYDRAADGDPRAIAMARTDRLLARLDRDGNGRLDAGESAEALGELFARIDGETPGADPAAIAESRRAALFEQFDADGDGRLTRDEARGSFLESGFKRADDRDPATNRGDGVLDDDEVLAYLDRFERGHDGLITRDELFDYQLQTNPGQDGILTEAELRSYFGGFRNNQGDGPRGTPTIDGDRVYAEGGNGDVTCLDAATGATLWHRNLVRDLDGGRPNWGYSESPLVEGNLLIVTPGGSKGTVAALDKFTGSTVWRSGEVVEGAHYASAVAADIAGVRQIVQFARESVFGVAADDGRLLWSYSGAANRTANVCTPIVRGNSVFAASAYNVGGGLVVIRSASGTQQADEVYFEKKMAVHHGGLVLVGEHLYGFGGAGLIAMNFATGEIAWMARSVRKGSLVYADGMLYCLGEGHEMALVEATPEAYREHGRFSIEDLGRRSWSHPVVAGGRLYLRNQQRLTAYDVAAR